MTMTNPMRPCDWHGPYFVESREGTKPRKVPLTCNRPHGHDGNHRHMTEAARILGEWTRKREPVRYAADANVVVVAHA